MNTLIPGIVDQAGIMDTTNQAIGQVDSVTINLQIGLTESQAGDTVDFRGLRYLDSLRYLDLQLNQEWHIPAIHFHGFPSGLRALSLDEWGGLNNPLHLNDLPAGLKLLTVHSYDELARPIRIGAMPDSLVRMDIMADGIVWDGTPYIHRLNFSWNGFTGLIFPTAVVDSMGIFYDNYMGSLDLSQVEAHQLTIISGVYSTEANFEAWPMGMSTLLIEGPMWHSAPCFPWFPDGLTSFNYSGPGVDRELCLPNWPSSLVHCILGFQQAYPDDVTYCSVLNSTCPGSNPGISGRVFMDVNADGQYTPGEPPLPQATLLIQPNGHVVGIEADGTWEVGVLPGNYTITPSSGYPYYQSFQPASHTANLPELGELDTLNDFAVTLEPNIQDLQARIHADPARPGFNDRLYLSCRNYGTVPMPAQLVLNYDSDQSWVGSSIPPDTHTGNTATWNLDTLGLGRTMQLTVDLFTDATVPLGTPINHQLSAFPVSSDETPSDNVVHVNDNVVGSFDPNDKLVDPPAMTPNDAQAGDNPITYTIRFQNTGTYLAERVVIVDTLPEGLQPQSIEFLSSSHTCHWYVRDGVLHFIHANINLPDSTSDEPGSHGYVQFRILPDTDLQDGAEVTNIAHIVFDFNAPIVTPPAIFRVNVAAHMDEASAPSVRIHPNPVRDRLWVLLPDMHHDMPYTVQDLSGRLVLRGRATRNDAVDVSALQPGPYMLSVIGNAGVRTSRFVKIQ